MRRCWWGMEPLPISPSAPTPHTTYLLPQELMRWQGYLHLVAARRESSAGATRERAAAAHLTLALRQYDRALCPAAGGGRAQGGAMTDGMAACVASCRLDLASFFLTWDAPLPAHAVPPAAPPRVTTAGDEGRIGVTARRAPAWSGGARSKHLEAALAHARLGLEVSRQLVGVATADASGPGGGGRETAAELASKLGDAAERAVRLLIRAAEVAGGGAASAALRDEYRQLLAERLTYENAAVEPKQGTN